MILKGAVAQVQSRNQSKPNVARRYWRILFNPLGGSFASPRYAEIGFMERDGTPNLAVGGTASASSTFGPSYAAAKAFDGDAVTYWAPTGRQMSGWIGYQFAEKVAINCYTLQARDAKDFNSTDLTLYDFTLQSSDDGITYTDEWTANGAPVWSPGEIRKFVRPGT